VISLLDVNVLVALFDKLHLHHAAAHDWFARERQHGWATCPLTENGLIRILSNPSYPGNQTSIEDAIRSLRTFRASGEHVFWPDDVSLVDESLVLSEHLQGYRQLTDVYLLTLAVSKEGRFATFDLGVSPVPVKGATPMQIVFIPLPEPPAEDALSSQSTRE
jgi:toxin-antitoxin system PIN domain toxin